MRDQAEFRLTCFVADLLRRFGSPDVEWTHFPAGENRSVTTGARLKRMGTQRGWADFIFVLPDGRTAFLELKTPKGKLSPEQMAFRNRHLLKGCKYGIAHTGDEAIVILRAWDVIRREVRAVA